MSSCCLRVILLWSTKTERFLMKPLLPSSPISVCPNETEGTGFFVRIFRIWTAVWQVYLVSRHFFIRPILSPQFQYIIITAPSHPHIPLITKKDQQLFYYPSMLSLLMMFPHSDSSSINLACPAHTGSIITLSRITQQQQSLHFLLCLSQTSSFPRLLYLYCWFVYLCLRF